MSSVSGERRRQRLAALAGSFTAALAASSLALAGFSSSTSATHTIQTKRIFSGSRTAASHALSDASSGSASVKDDPLSYADAIIDTTGTFANTFQATRFLKFSFNNPLPAGVAVSSVTFDFRMIPNAGGETACYYFEVHRISDDSLLGTHFSSGSPQCNTGTTYTTISTSLSEVTSSDIANDMYVKVFGRSSAARQFKIDMATVTLTMYGQTITLHEKAYTDQSTGIATTGSILGLDVAGDSITYTNTSNWPTTYTSTNYLQLSFPVMLPAGSVISGVTYNRTWHSGGIQNVCYYFEVYSGSTLLGTHGSGSQISCSNSILAWNTDGTSVSEVTSATDANQLVIKVYEKASLLGQTSVDDLDTLTITYYLD